MSRIVLIGIMALAVWACSPARETAKSSALLRPDSTDTTEYDIVIIDPYFDQWYLLNYSEPKDRPNEYYRHMNTLAAASWNDYYRSAKHTNVIDAEVNYHPETDYGIDVNRKLYWYFRFVENKYRIRLFR